MSERRPGYYFVKVRSRPIVDPWVISHWRSDETWWPHHPAEIIEIDERPITRTPAPAGEVEAAVKWAPVPLPDDERLEAVAKAIFLGEPYSYDPNQRSGPKYPPRWDEQPDTIKSVFRRKAGSAISALAAAATRAAQERRAAVEVAPLAGALAKLIPDIGDQIQRARERLEPHQIEALREFEDFLRKE